MNARWYESAFDAPPPLLPLANRARDTGEIVGRINIFAGWYQMTPFSRSAASADTSNPVALSFERRIVPLADLLCCLE
jgi:hypothetical protein